MAFIIIGIIVGPVGLNLIASTEDLRVLAEMGLTLLLFVVGLKLDPHHISQMGKVSVATGLGQIAFTGILTFIVSKLFGMPTIAAAYVAAALVFSSTILIIKLLSDKGDTDSLYGRLSVGRLIVEDVVVVTLMVILSIFTVKSSLSLGMNAVFILVKGSALFAGVWLIKRYVFPHILPIISQSAELLLLFGISWALVLASVSDIIGFNKEVGAFIAGLTLATTIYRDTLSIKLSGIRDFLLFFFFLELGSHLNLQQVGSVIGPAIALSLIVVIGKPLIVMFILSRFGYKKRIGFMSGLTVAQISEFSLILMSMGVAAGHITANTLGLITLVLIITMGIDIHLITHAQKLYLRLAPMLRVFEPKLNTLQQGIELHGDVGPAEVIVFGLGRYGAIVCRRMRQMNREVLGIDFNPDTVRIWHRKNRRAVYGDAGDPEFLASLPLHEAKWVVSAVHDADTQKTLLESLKELKFEGTIACTADNTRQARVWEKMGADLVFRPYQDAAEQAVDIMLIKEEEIERQQMDSQILSLRDHFIICGFGRMGQQIAKDLKNSGVPFVVIEDNTEQLPRLKELGILHIVGKASEDEALVKAGIEHAKGLVSVLPTDEDNVFVVLSARVLNPRLTIVARSILEENEAKLRRAGADRVISPYILGGHRMAALITNPQITDFLEMVMHNDQFDLNMGHVVIPANSSVIGKTIKELDLNNVCGVTVLAIRNSAGVHIDATNGSALSAGDDVIMLGSETQLHKASEYLGCPLAS